MYFWTKQVDEVVNTFNSNVNQGLNKTILERNKKLYGQNVITKDKKISLFKRIINVLKEPMLIILIFAFIIAFGTSFGEYLKTKKADFTECIGVFMAIFLSTFITLVMEGSSKKAFEMLGKLYDNISVKVIRNGKVELVKKEEITVGDIVLLESGDKIVADCRIIKANNLSVDESALTGESLQVFKSENKLSNINTPLAERINCVFAGTYVSSGNGKAIVTDVGDNTEIGKIAQNLKGEKQIKTPLEQKLASLGKKITIIGIICALLVFVVSFLRLYFSQNLIYKNVQELFISCIILIVATVPEGLPTIVAMSLALNMIKLAKQNALIKKMIATETAGAISVICTDKTGTLTQNKMSIEKLFVDKDCRETKNNISDIIIKNICLNTTAEVVKKANKFTRFGSASECAMLEYVYKNQKIDYDSLRNIYKIIDREPFSSQKKYMSSTVNIDGEDVTFFKGAPEVILDKCELTEAEKKKIINSIEKYQQNARRVICFSHEQNKKCEFDGYVSIVDPIREDVKHAINLCKKAGIKIKILTGDNYLTATAVAKELGVVGGREEVVNAKDIESLDVIDLAKVLEKVSVIARSTPSTKLKVVKSLQKIGEVVAVTGDGINDAPAIKNADIGICMGISGSELTKESADIVLLDDSFSTIVKSISFGRNVYKNLQRFILFQLTVNVSALILIICCTIFSLNSPFNTLQLLWINVIMDGPPALTLGLESGDESVLLEKPIKRNKSIITTKMLAKIIFNGIYVASIIILQIRFNILGADPVSISSATFTLFVMFHLFNAFNCRELGSKSIFRNVLKNKIMLLTFLGTFILQILITIFTSPIEFSCWLKIIFISFSSILITESYKIVYKLIKAVLRKKYQSNINKKSLGA